MPFKFRNKLLLAKIESVYGTDPVPTGGANSILAKDFDLTPMNSEVEKRNLARPYLGNDESIPVGIHRQLSFKVEMASSGAAGTAPKWGPLLRACGFAETITVATMVEYEPVSAGEESITLHFHMGPNRFKFLGARGAPSIVLDAKRIPHLEFNFLGLFVAATAETTPTPDFAGFPTPKPAGKVNTPTFTLHGQALRTDRLQLGLGVDVQYRELVGGQSVEIVDRQPAGSVGIEEVALATIDFFDRAEKVTLGALQLIHGVGAGNIVQIDAPRVQVGVPKHRDSQGISMLDIPLTLVPDTGDDEIKITVK